MSKCDSDGYLRYVYYPLVMTTVLLAGCGGGTPDVDSPEKNPAPSSAPAIDSAPATKVEIAPQPGASSTESPAPIPSADTGIQLPSDALPESDTIDAGPTPPGQGGIEMPQLDAPLPSNESALSPANGGNAPIRLQLAGWAEIERQAKSTGKITVVDLWSTACAPCIEEFPSLVRLSKEMPQDLACIGVSVDYDGRKTRPPESYSEKVTAFLSAVGAGFDNYLCNTPSDDVYATVGLPSIPAVLIYDANGALVKQFVDAGDTAGFSYDADVIPFLKTLSGS